MEKKTMPRVLAMLLAIALVCTSIITVPSTNAQAATKAKKITLTAKTQTLYVGKSKGSFTLKVKSVTPAKASKAVTYKSSKPSVASVDKQGKVKAKKVGTTTITVTSTGNKKVKATCKVTVKEGAKKIQAPAEIILKKGSGKATVTLGFTPSSAKNATAKEMKFSTNKKNVATASAKGKNVQITAKKKTGTAKITIQPKDGSAPKVTIKVTVKSKVTPVKTIKLNSTALNLNAGESATLKTTLTPKKPDSKKVNWISTDETVAKVNKNGVVTAVANGTAKIIATAVSGGKSATCTVNVTTAPTGIALDWPALTLQAGGDAALLTAFVAPETVSDPTVIWTVDPADTTVVAITPVGQQAFVTPLAEGTVTVYATTVNGLTAACAVTVVSGNAAVVDGAGNLTVTLNKAVPTYSIEGVSKNPFTIDMPTFISDYNQFVADLGKDIYKSEDGQNFFQKNWSKFADKLKASNMFQLQNLVSDINVKVEGENTIKVTGKTSADVEKTVTIVRRNDTADTCDLTITADDKTVTLKNVTVAKAEDGKVTVDAKIARDGKDEIPVTLSMTATETKVYLYGEDTAANSVMTFTDNAEANAYVITVDGGNYSHIKHNLGLSFELGNIAVWNVK